MGILANISGKKAVKIFCKFGYVVDHQTGSHIILWHDSKPTLSVPNHKELAPDTRLHCSLFPVPCCLEL